ncbi:collagen alpha-1(X) chain-like [Macrobrachium nipponense]|uniref:collagen alpha-1(X) chain-like n=1 Tax=Macrobrachium nipponense TaxID=159736 RepID=UPI0030C7DE02
MERENGGVQAELKDQLEDEVRQVRGAKEKLVLQAQEPAGELQMPEKERENGGIIETLRKMRGLVEGQERKYRIQEDWTAGQARRASPVRQAGRPGGLPNQPGTGRLGGPEGLPKQARCRQAGGPEGLPSRPGTAGKRAGRGRSAEAGPVQAGGREKVCKPEVLRAAGGGTKRSGRGGLPKQARYCGQEGGPKGLPSRPGTAGRKHGPVLRAGGGGPKVLPSRPGTAGRRAGPEGLPKQARNWRRSRCLVDEYGGRYQQLKSSSDNLF